MWLLVLSLILLAYCWRRWLMHHSRLPPGPVNIPLLGSWEMVKLYLNNGDMSEMFARLGARYGPVVFMRIAMDTPLIAIRTHDVIEKASQNVLLGSMGQPFFNKVSNNFRNLGVSFNDGEHRVMNRKFLKRVLFKHAYQEKDLEIQTNYECGIAMNMIRASKGKPFDLKDVMTLANNTSFKIIFGDRFAPDDARISRLKRQIASIFLSVVKTQTFLDFLPWLKTWSSDFRTVKETMDNLYTLVDEMIAKHQASFDPAKDEPRDMIEDYLADLAQENPGSKSLDDLRVYIKDMIVGSAEGPSLMLIWMLLMLAKHQKVQAQVHSELDSQLTGGRPPQLSDEAECVYTRAVIDETVRFVTLTPFNRHDSSMGATTLNGYHIPANSILLVDQRSMHHDPEIWGDPEVFRPERFLSADGEKLRRCVHGWGFSARQCPAEMYSRSLIFIFLSGLLQKFRIRLPDGTGLRDDGTYGVAVRAGETKVIAEERA